MNNSNLNLKKISETVRDSELKRLRLKILDVIRFSEHYWMIYKEQTFGIATILDLKYKRLYIEVLFFSNSDVIKRGVPLIKIYTPTDTQFDFNEVIVNPDFDDDGLVSPKILIERVNKLIEKEIKYHLEFLNKEIKLINKNFESYPIEENPYFRKISIYLPDVILKFRINLENYPLMPKLTEKSQLIIEKYIKTFRQKLKEKLREKFRGEIRQKADKLKIMKKKIIINTEILKNWDVEKPPHLFEVIKSILDVKEGSQHLVLNNVSITNKIKGIIFEIHRGQSVGIYYDTERPNREKDNTTIMNLFSAIAGTYLEFSGKIIIFGKKIQSKVESKKEGIFIVSHKFDSKMEGMTIKNAIQHNIKIKPKWKIRKRALSIRSKSTGILSRIDEFVSLTPKYKTKKSFINSALEVTGLLNRKSEEISNLSPIDRLLFSISRVLLKSPKIIMFSIPSVKLGRLEIEQFNSCIEKIKRKFHVILIIRGPTNIVSNCDQILIVIGQKAEIGSISDFVSKIPQSGEILTVELNNPDEKALKKMLEIKSAKFIEERKNEKYKIFSKESLDNLIIKLMQVIGQYIYNIKRHKASLAEYLEFLEIK